MNGLIEKLAALEREVSARKGPFALFAIVHRDEAPNRWDLVVAAPWTALERGRQNAVQHLISELKTHVRADDLVQLSRVVVLKPTDRFVDAMNQAFTVEHGRVEVKDSDLFGVPVKHAYIVTSKRRPKTNVPRHRARRRSPTPR